MEKNKKQVLKKHVNHSFLRFVASVTTFMQSCDNVELTKKLSMYIAFYMWSYVNCSSGISLQLYNSFVNDVMIEFQKFGEYDEYKTCELLWLIGK